MTIRSARTVLGLGSLFGLALVAWGCGGGADGATSDVDAGPEDAVQVEPDANGGADADAASDPDSAEQADAAADATAPDCGWISVLDGPHLSAPPFVPWRVAVASAEVAYLSGDPRVAAPGEAVYALRTADGELEVAGDASAAAAVLDARGGARLEVALAAAGVPDGANLVRYTTDAGAVELVGAAPAERVLEPVAFGRPQRLVAGGRAAWRSCLVDGAGACTTRRLRAWAGNGGAAEVVTLWEEAPGSAGLVSAPHVTADGVTWAEPTADGAILRRWAGGSPMALHTLDAPVAQVVRVGDRVLWIGLGDAWAAPDDGAPAALGLGRCDAVDSDGAIAAVVCHDAAARAAGTASGDDRLWIYRDGESHAIATDGAVIVAAQVDGGRVGWVTYLSPDAGCSTLGAGTVHVADAAGTGREGVVQAEIGIGCYCCNSLWPTVEFSLHDGLAAWNYATPTWDEALAPELRGAGLGWMRVTGGCGAP